MKVERQNPIHQGSSRFHSVNAKASSYRFSNMNKDTFHFGYHSQLLHSQRLPQDMESVKSYNELPSYRQTAIAKDIERVKERRS
jgi:hypothetical protein